MTISPSTAAVLSMATADPLIFKAELDTVRGRLDQVRSFEHETSVWAQYNFNNFGVSSSAGAGYDMGINGLTLGVDKSVEAGDGVFTFGGFTSYSNSDMEFDRGGDGEVDSYSVGGYGSYMHNSGFYVDGVLKANRFAHDVNAQMNSGSRAYGNYDANGIGAHLQTGKYFWFDETYVAPYVGMSAFVSDSSNYTLSNGMKAQVDNQRSMVGEVGVQVGHNFEVNGSKIQPYFRAALAQEFIDSNDVKVNEDHFTNDLSGSRGIYQVGVNAKVTDTINVNVNASYSHGKQVDEPLAAHVGVVWTF
jgi:outer membrane autotransporter protein